MVLEKTIMRKRNAKKVWYNLVPFIHAEKKVTKYCVAAIEYLNRQVVLSRQVINTPRIRQHKTYRLGSGQSFPDVVYEI